MRLTGKFAVHPNVPGYAPFLEHGGFDSKWTVWLDGLEQRMVVSLDTEAGWVLVNMPDETGMAYVTDSGEIARKKKYGTVEVDVQPTRALPERGTNNGN